MKVNIYYLCTQTAFFLLSSINIVQEVWPQKIIRKKRKENIVDFLFKQVLKCFNLYICGVSIHWANSGNIVDYNIFFWRYHPYAGFGENWLINYLRLALLFLCENSYDHYDCLHCNASLIADQDIIWNYQHIISHFFPDRNLQHAQVLKQVNCKGLTRWSQNENME